MSTIILHLETKLLSIIKKLSPVIYKTHSIPGNNIELTGYFNLEKIITRGELLEKAIANGNLVRTESHNGYDTKYYHVSELGDAPIPVTEL